VSLFTTIIRIYSVSAHHTDRQTTDEDRHYRLMAMMEY